MVAFDFSIALRIVRTGANVFHPQKSPFHSRAAETNFRNGIFRQSFHSLRTVNNRFLNQQRHWIAGKQRSNFLGYDSAGSIRQFQAIRYFDFCKQQQYVLSADLQCSRPVRVVVGNRDGVCPEPRRTPLLSTWFDSVFPKDHSNKFDQSFRGTAGKIFLYRHCCSIPKFVFGELRPK